MQPQQGFWEKMQAIDRRILYFILIVATTIGVFINVEVPAVPDKPARDFYAKFTAIDPKETVLLQSDFTLSTRGENLGHLEAILRLLMARDQKFVVYALADPQAPQVARDAIRDINLERKRAGQKTFVRGVDYLDLGYFPNAEGTTQAMGTDLRSVWGGRKTKLPDGNEVGIFDSEPLKGINRIEDLGAIVYVTASNTIDTGIQRLTGKIPIFCMCTGVVGPTILPYYQSQQVLGLASGLKGVYDMELLMRYGINLPKEGTNKIANPDDQIQGTVAPLENSVTLGRGKKYFAALNIALGLLVLAVVLGNIAMFASKKQGGKR